MATILDGLQRGANRSRSYFDRQTNRRLAAEQGAREQSEFEQGQRAQDYTNVFVRLRDQGFVTVDTSAENPRLRLSNDFNTRLAAGYRCSASCDRYIEPRASGQSARWIYDRSY